MVLDPKRRQYSEAPHNSKLKDIDAVARTQKLRALGLSLYGGGFQGLVAGSVVGHPFLGVIIGPALIYTFVTLVAHFAGKGAGALHMPSGSTTPKKREYSRAKALEIRGEYMEAIKAYEVAIHDDPEIGEPYLLIARLFRDELKELDLAVHWFRRAQRKSTLSTGESIRSHRELAEIFLHIRREPTRAAPELAQLAERFPNTLDGEWAARELAVIKEAMTRETREPDTP
jgi:tetratricopeptide (TPR) repeat protein